MKWIKACKELPVEEYNTSIGRRPRKGGQIKHGPVYQGTYRQGPQRQGDGEARGGFIGKSGPPGRKGRQVLIALL
jgi:hypothetical protein